MRVFATTPLALFLFVAACGSNPTSPQDAAAATDDAGMSDGDSDGPALPPFDNTACLVIDRSGDGGAGEPPFTPGYMPLASGSIQEDKNFYLLTLLEKDSTLASALSSDSAVTALAMQHDSALRTAAANCGTNVSCYATALRFTTDGANAAGKAIVAALSNASLIAPLAQNHLRPSGDFNLHFAQSDSDLLTSAWTDTLVALDDAYDGYAASLNPAMLQSVVRAVVAANPAPMPVWRPLLAVVLAALISQQRDEATRYEPLAAGENHAALQRISQIDFSHYPYSIILVPGEGPTDPNTPLDPTGQMRCDLAVIRYNAGFAPFLFVSGGHVHPDRTRFSEAIQMKKYLMTVKGIPEEAILIDPHARHTTTNLRNVTRLLLRYGIPAARPVLITSDIAQCGYIDLEALGFWARCDAELFYRPWRSMHRLGPNDGCMMPSAMSLYVSGLDPLDP